MLTDGKAGDEQQCLGVAALLSQSPEIRRVAPRTPWVWLMPFGPIDPKDKPNRSGSPISPPFPDCAIASGRRAVPYLRAIKAASKGRTFTVFLKDPRTGAHAADLIWVPEHDELHADNVLRTLTPPHRVSKQRIAAARHNPDPRIAGLSSPRIAVVVGGNSKHHRFTDADIDSLVEKLETVAKSGVSLMITASRRTPDALRDALERIAREHRGFLWDGSGDNPYVDLLALADAVVVTADSYNMLGEAAATGVPLLVFEPSGGHRKLSLYLDKLTAYGATRPFTGQIEGERYPPLDSTPFIADQIRDALARHRSALGLSSAADT